MTACSFDALNALQLSLEGSDLCWREREKKRNPLTFRHEYSFLLDCKQEEKTFDPPFV